MNTKKIEAKDLKNIERWSITLGIFLILLGILAIVTLPSILGILAIASPIVALRSMTVVLSWTFLVAGILRISLTIQTQYEKGFWLQILLSVFHFAVSILLFKHIIGSVFPLALALGITIFIEGVFEVFLAFRLRPNSIWNCLLLLQGIAMIILGISIGSKKPFSDFAILVLLPGISLLSTGLWTIVFSQAICAKLQQRLPLNQVVLVRARCP
ncbi:HdeD family acid-resistance protein [Allocoleopsis sp.]|uniref:HdeD family acid-resistance protein n=1 Tax=Allocoleopsis sp. TaxID=3088169 RepID=UPI002FD13A1B